MRPVVKSSLTIILAILLAVFGLSSVSLGAVITLGWDPPTTYEDGSPLEDLAGYRVYYAKAPGLDKQDASIKVPLTNLIDINNPTCTIVGLTLGQQYCFAVSDYDIYNNNSGLSNEVCGVAKKKEVELVAPNVAEVLKSGNSFPIQWKVNGTKSPVTKVNLYYTTDKGVSYVLINTVAGSDRSYNWTVPTPLSNKKNTCYVKVVAYHGSTVVGSDTSDKPFTIEVVKLIQPNGGETLSSGSSYPIQWEINGTKSPVTKVNLYYTTDKGVSYVLISTLAGSDRSYNWTVPTPLSNKKNACYVKMVAYHDSTVVGSDTSDKPFTIEVVKIVQPNGGETLSSGSSYRIKWEINGTKSPVTKVNLYYTTNKGVSYVLIKSISTVDPGTRPWVMSYQWTPTVTSTKPNCKVKVVLYNAKNTVLSSDVSENYFTILLP